MRVAGICGDRASSGRAMLRRIPGSTGRSGRRFPGADLRRDLGVSIQNFATRRARPPANSREAELSEMWSWPKLQSMGWAERAGHWNDLYTVLSCHETCLVHACGKTVDNSGEVLEALHLTMG